MQKTMAHTVSDAKIPEVLKNRLKRLFIELPSCLGREDLPSAEEILVVFGERELPPPVIDHSLCVAEVAVTIGGWLAAAGSPVDVPALAAAAVLHDVAKGEPGHAAGGAKYVAGRGYMALASLIATHMELEFSPGEVPGEAAILFLADKLCRDNTLVSLEERLKQSICRYGDLPGIRGKFAAGFHIRDSVLRVVASAGISAVQSKLWQVVTGEKSSMSGV